MREKANWYASNCRIIKTKRNVTSSFSRKEINLFGSMSGQRKFKRKKTNKVTFEKMK